MGFTAVRAGRTRRQAVRAKFVGREQLDEDRARNYRQLPRRRRRVPVNVKIFLEGEEETGSLSLRSSISKYGNLLRSDAVLSADGGRAHPEVPTLNTGARGNVKLEIGVHTMDVDPHAGRYGGLRPQLHVD